MATTTYYTGIDLHKRTAYLTTVDENGTVAGQKKLPCRRDRFCQYFRSFDGDGSHQAAVETTTGWYWVADLLREEGVTLKLAHAKYLKAISYAKVKTDKVDSETLAQLLRADMIPEAHQIDRELRSKRDTLRTLLAFPCLSGQQDKHYLGDPLIRKVQTWQHVNPTPRSLNERLCAWPTSAATAAPSPASSAFIAKGFLGVSMIRRWKDQLEENGDRAFPGQGSPRDEEMAKLRRELRRVKEENAILKKAVGIFKGAP